VTPPADTDSAVVAAADQHAVHTPASTARRLKWKQISPAMGTVEMSVAVAYLEFKEGGQRLS